MLARKKGQCHKPEPLLITLPLESLTIRLTRSAVGIKRVTSPIGFLICGLASMVAVLFFSSADFCGGFMMLGGALSTLEFTGGIMPGGGIPGGGMLGGAPGGLIILGGGIPG